MHGLLAMASLICLNLSKVKIAQYLVENKATMGQFKLEKSGKLWWINHCLENTINPAKITWDYLKTQLQANYHNKTFQLECLNEFLDCSQGAQDLESFYQHFLKLLKYAPASMN